MHIPVGARRGAALPIAVAPDRRIKRRNVGGLSSMGSRWHGALGTGRSGVKRPTWRYSVHNTSDTLVARYGDALLSNAVIDNRFLSRRSRARARRTADHRLSWCLAKGTARCTPSRRKMTSPPRPARFGIKIGFTGLAHLLQEGVNSGFHDFIRVGALSAGRCALRHLTVCRLMLKEIPRGLPYSTLHHSSGASIVTCLI
jgi:hypothetical protein